MRRAKAPKFRRGPFLGGNPFAVRGWSGSCFHGCNISMLHPQNPGRLTIWSLSLSETRHFAPFWLFGPCDLQLFDKKDLPPPGKGLPRGFCAWCFSKGPFRRFPFGFPSPSKDGDPGFQKHPCSLEGCEYEVQSSAGPSALCWTGV